VLAAIYAAYGAGWDDAFASPPIRAGLAEEAVWLARLLTALLPAAPEAQGLLALMLHCEARRPARRSADGRFVPLDRQDTTLWSRPLIVEAEAVLAEAGRANAPGRFQIEAAIHSVHAQRAITGTTNWPAIAALYALLVRLSPAIGVRVAQAASIGEAGNPAAALTLLDDLAPDCRTYQPWWACRARALHLLGETAPARAAWRHAAGLSTDPAVRAWLLAQADA
jgi:RNA polymerase sigma-70 factor (ECF subfamily)